MRLLFCTVLATLLLACSASDGEVERPYVTCAGACDAPGSLPELTAIDLSEILTCTSVIDVTALDDFSANDRLECSLASAPVDGASLTVSITVLNSELIRELGLSAGETGRLGSIPRNGYPYDVRASIRFGLPGGSAATFEDTLTVFDYGAFRDLEVEEMVFNLPARLWPVRIWPDTAVQAAWAQRSIRLIGFVGTATVPFGTSELRASARPTANASHHEVVTLPDVLFAHVPVPLEGGQVPTTVQMYRRGEGTFEQASTLTGPGYYVLDTSGGLTLTAIAELPILPGYAGYGTAVPNEADPEPEPVVIPDDPCSGECRSDEACVGGSCIERRTQTQDPGACDSPSPSACDVGERGDCAELHVCIGTECRHIVCQRQVYPDCPAPSASCETDDDCYPGHTCVDNACRNDNC